MELVRPRSAATSLSSTPSPRSDRSSPTVIERWEDRSESLTSLRMSPFRARSRGSPLLGHTDEIVCLGAGGRSKEPLAEARVPQQTRHTREGLEVLAGVSFGSHHREQDS